MYYLEPRSTTASQKRQTLGREERGGKRRKRVPFVPRRHRPDPGHPGLSVYTYEDLGEDIFRGATPSTFSVLLPVPGIPAPNSRSWLIGRRHCTPRTSGPLVSGVVVRTKQKCGAGIRGPLGPPPEKSELLHPSENGSHSVKERRKVLTVT